MPGLDERAAPQPDSREEERSAARNARRGLVLFALYVAIYGAFVLLAAFAPSAMEREALFGVNLAVVFGVAVIVSALVLALVYGWLCRGQASPNDSEGRA